MSIRNNSIDQEVFKSISFEDREKIKALQEEYDLLTTDSDKDENLRQQEKLLFGNIL